MKILKDKVYIIKKNKLQCLTCAGLARNQCSTCLNGKPISTQITCCHNQCLTCTGLARNQCSTCLNGKSISTQNTCCHYQCLTCTGLSRNQCSTCLNGKSISTQNTCCHNQCITCTGLSRNQCSTCLNGKSISTQNTCCHYQCLTCTGLSRNQCSTCLNGKPISTQNTCCHYQCLTCTGLARNQCSTCLNGKPISTQTTCCHNQCLTCTGLSRNQCSTCNNISFLFLRIQFTCCYQLCLSCSGSLINNCQSCFSNRYLQANNTCQLCHSSCLTCFGPLRTNCNSCIVTLFRDNNSLTCCHPTCQTCSDILATSCLSCSSINGLQSFLIISDNSCSNSCPFDFYKYHNNRTCLACDGSCAGCQLNPYDCISCQSGYYRVIGSSSCKPCQDKLNYTRAEFSIDICLMKQGSQYSAMISLQNNNTSDVYELKVSQSYIDQNAQMSLLYQDPQKFFFLLKQEESTITTNSNAQILIQNKFFRMLRLTSRKQILDKTDIINRLIILQSNQKEMIENEEKLKQSLAQTKKQLQVQKDLINRIKQQYNREIMMLKNNITQMSLQIDLLRNQNKAQIAQVKNVTLSLNSTIETQKQSNELQSTQIKLIQTALFYELSSLQKINNANFQNYAMQTYNNTLKLTFKSTNSMYGFFKTPFIQVGKITRLKVRQTKTDKSIMYGVSTDKTIGMNIPFNHLEFKSYDASFGYIYQNGAMREGGAPIEDGTVVTIIADLINWKISWEVNGSIMDEADISVAMRASKLYFIITMATQNNEVEILDYY